MREIKFRGLNTADGSEGMTTFTLGELLATSEDYDLVDPDTVAQLVAVDKNGREVYEGDIVVDADGNEYTAFLCAMVNSKVEYFPFGNGYFPPIFTLKEESA